MAESKSGGREISPWPWLIGLIILAGFRWIMLTYVYMPEGNSDHMFAGKSIHSGTHYIPPKDTINEVKEFIYYLSDTSVSSTTKKYTEKGLIKLQSAISFVADKSDSTDSSITSSINILDRKVAKIDTSSENYFAQLKPALSAAVNAMQSIQKLNYPELSGYISNLKNSEKKINSKKSIGSQITEIKYFFSEACNTLKQMKISYSYTIRKSSF